MTDTQDDAPISTSKHSDKVQHAAGTIVEDKGDSLISRSVTINRPAAELFAFWRDFSNLPLFMDNLVRVEVLDSHRSHWVVKAPAHQTVEWDSLITEEREGQMIAWASTDNADISNSGRVDFKDVGARGSVVTLTILYDPPAGIIGKVTAKLFQREPAIQARRELRRFKQFMETGEVATAARNQRELEEENS